MSVLKNEIQRRVCSYLFCFSAIRDESWCGYVVLKCLREVVAVAVVKVGTQVDSIEHPDVSLLVRGGTTTRTL